MKQNVIRLAFPTVAVLTLLMFFNSCKGSILGSGFSSKSASCKTGLEKGIVTKMEFNPSIAPKPFLTSKVRLRDEETSSSSAGQQKATAPVDLSAGVHLSAIVDNACLDFYPNGEISSRAIATGERSERLSRQAYEWTLERTYDEDELNAAANADRCVIGVSWNKDYKLASMAFNDANFPYQTQFPAVRAQESYDLFYGSGAGAMSTSTGNSVVVAVIDTGIDWNHPDLKSNVWVHSQGVGIDITTLGTALVDYNPFDVSGVGHGTHVSGLIAAVSNNSTGTVGLMPYRAKIMAIKLFKRATTGELSTTSTYFYNAIQFAYLNKADVINLSLGSFTAGPATDAVAEAGVDEALQNGVTVVTVMGNADSGNGVNIDGTTATSIPGIYAAKSGVLGVGSFDTSTGAKSYFSHYSTKYGEIAAPGAENGTDGIYSTLPTSLGSYGRLAGTSQAAPLVSAAAALTIGLIRNAYTTPPTPAEVERLLLASAKKDATLSTSFKDGNKLDLYQLVQKINADYPSTRTGAAVAASSACP